MNIIAKMNSFWINRKFAFVFLFILPINTLATECILSDLNDPIKVVIEFQKCDQIWPAVVSSYRVSDFPIVLTGLNGDFNTVAILQKGSVVLDQTLSHPLIIQNGLYEFHNPYLPSQNFSFELNRHLSSLSVKEALIWNIGLKFPLQDTPIESWGIKIHLALMVHEGFHFFAQQLLKTPINWPKNYLGISHEVRTQIQEKCFNLNPTVQNFSQLERRKILDTFTFTQAGDDVNAKLKAGEFLETRRMRYIYLKGIEIINTDSSSLTCEEAENFASIVEGVPEFVGLSTLLKLGLLTSNEIINYFPEKDSALYYRFPLYQALVISSESTDFLSEALEHPEFGLSKVFDRWTKN